MKKQMVLVLTSLVVVLFASGIVAAQGEKKVTKGDMDMDAMHKSPHHMLMMAHMKSMSEFTKTLNHQAIMPTVLDVEFSRAAVAELRHHFDAIAAIHQEHMESMSPEMKSKMDAMSGEMKAKMQMMMEKMDKERSLVNDMVRALETDVQAKTPDSKQVAMHATALLKHLAMMSKMHGGDKPGKKMAMKKKMTMKKKMNTGMKPM